MNRTFSTLPLVILIGAVVPAVAAGDALPATAMTEPAPAGVAPDGLSIDYVLGLLEAGMKEGLIVDLIRSRDLRFDLRPGDLDRLLTAGAGEALIGAVVRNGRRVDPPSWSRPRRLEEGATTGGTGSSGGTVEEDAGEPPPEERWYGGVYTSVGASYGYGYWAYPDAYPYFSYYYAYPYSYRYGYPYYGGYGYRHAPGPPRGYGAPRSGGWHSSPPRGSGSAPRGGSSGSRPPANRSPRGSH